MREKFFSGFLAVALLTLSATAAAAGESKVATATLMSSDGKVVGVATFTETPHGVLIAAELQNLPPGPHGFHIHETGKCEPDFKAAGGHFAPDGKAHGFNFGGGYHAGDLPNIMVNDSGLATVHFFNHRVTLGEGANSLLDGDGSALIVHEKPDSYLEDAMAGGRIACGVIAE